MQPIPPEISAFTPSVLLQVEGEGIVTPGLAVGGLFLMAVLMGLFLVLILREKVKDRRRQAPSPSVNFMRHVPPLPEKRSSKNPPRFPKQR